MLQASYLSFLTIDRLLGLHWAATTMCSRSCRQGRSHPGPSASSSLSLLAGAPAGMGGVVHLCLLCFLVCVHHSHQVENLALDVTKGLHHVGYAEGR